MSETTRAKYTRESSGSIEVYDPYRDEYGYFETLEEFFNYCWALALDIAYLVKLKIKVDGKPVRLSFALEDKE